MNLKTEITRKQSKLNFPPKIEHFLLLDTHTYVCVSGGKKCSFFRKFHVLCFLVTSVLWFTLLSYYRRFNDSSLSDGLKSRLCYVMVNLFTVSSLQFCNDTTIAALEANQNRPKLWKIQMDIPQCNTKYTNSHTKSLLTCTHPESNWYKTWQRCFITFTSCGVEFEHWPLWIGFTNRFWNSFFVPNSFGLTKSTITKSMDDFM